MIYLIVYALSFMIYTFLPNRINYYFFCLMTLFLIVDILLIMYARLIIKIEMKYKKDISYTPHDEKITLMIKSSYFPLGYLKGIVHYENPFHQFGGDIVIETALTNKDQLYELVIPIKYSGIYQFSLDQFIIYDLLGLLHFKINRNITFEKMILPSKNDQYQLSNINDLTNKQHKQKQRTDTYQDDFEFIDYQEGMPLSKIHRKLSFKFDKPIVIQYNGYLNENVNVYLKADEDKDQCENKLKVYSAFSADLIEKKIPYVLHINELNHYSIQNHTQWQHAMQQLYRSSKTGPKLCYKHNASLILQESENEIYKVESL